MSWHVGMGGFWLGHLAISDDESFAGTFSRRHRWVFVGPCHLCVHGPPAFTLWFRVSHTHTYIYTYIHAYIHTYIYAWVYLHTHYTHLYIYIHTYIHISYSLNSWFNPMHLCIYTYTLYTYQYVILMLILYISLAGQAVVLGMQQLQALQALGVPGCISISESLPTYLLSIHLSASTLYYINYIQYIYMYDMIYMYMYVYMYIYIYTSSTAQGGGGSFRIGNL